MNKLIFAVLATVVFAGATQAQLVSAQETEYTRCVNSKGEVVTVTNWTCPAGFWPS